MCTRANKTGQTMGASIVFIYKYKENEKVYFLLFFTSASKEKMRVGTNVKQIEAHFSE